MGKYKDLDQERVYNSVVKIVNTSVLLNLAVPIISNNKVKVLERDFFNNKGYAITAAHVVENSIELWIKLPKWTKNI